MNESTEIVDAIWEHWVIHRALDIDEANMMRDELALHLAEARERGSSTKAVVGNDIRSFADEWADQVADRSTRHRFASGLQNILAASCGLSFAAVTANWSFDLSVRLIPTALSLVLLAAGASMLLGRRASRLRRRGVLGQLPHVVLVGVIAGAMFIVWLWLNTYVQLGPEITVPRLVAMIMAALGTLFLLAVPFGPWALATLRRVSGLRQ